MAISWQAHLRSAFESGPLDLKHILTLGQAYIQTQQRV